MKTLIFDIDGTLLDTLALNWQSLDQLYQETFQVPLALEQYMHLAALPGPKIMECLGFEQIEEAYPRWVAGLNRLPAAKPFAQIEALLEAMHQAGITMALFSSKNHAQYQIDVVPQSFAGYFTQKVLAEDVQHHKPHPQGLRLLCERLGVEPSECLYIGDTLLDYQAAHAANMHFALAKWGALPDLCLPEDALIIETPLSLLKYI